MKKIFSLALVITFLLSISWAWAYTQNEKLAADFLSYKDIIVAQEEANKYELDKEITRREMWKVTLKLSGLNVWTSCTGMFTDLNSNDWGCKYAELGVNKWFFAKNESFNAGSSISKIEALKMVMKGTGVEKDETDDWREWYVTAAVKFGLLEGSFSDYDTLATRWWIFIMAQHAIEYGEDEDIKLIEDLLNI